MNLPHNPAEARYPVMKNAITYFEPVHGSTQSAFDAERYRQSVELYDAQRYTEAFHTFLDSLNPKFRPEYGNAEGTEFHIPHGSIVVDIHLTDDRLRIHADFMELPAKGSVAMLRQVAGLNTNQLLLPTFLLEGNRLTLDYTCPMQRTHPAKFYGVLRDICYIGDQYDDEFAAKFGATRLYTPNVQPYSAEETARLYDAIQTICREALAAVKEYDANRQGAYSWNILETAVYQILYTAAPQGQLLNELDKAVADLDRDLPLNELNQKGAEALRKLAAMSREELARDLYHVDTLISTKRRSSLRNVQDNLREVYGQAEQAIQGGNFEAAAIRMLYKFYEMYYYCDVQDNINGVVARALAKASGQPWEEAAEALYDAMDALMEGNLEGDDDTDFDFSAAIGEAAREMQENLQATVGDVQSLVQEMQQKMAEALARGDMQEYMRLAAEMQQKIMQQALGGNQ